MSQQRTPKPASRLLITATVLFYLFSALAMVMANKWVLNTTVVPLFFLHVQVLIAVGLFLATNAAGFIELPPSPDLQLCKGLMPTVSLSVIGLSFSNYTLKYVDASFYQVARGLVLPFTVATSFLLLHSRPSTLILFSCSIVTLGFFTGVFLDGTPISFLGVFFGVASSAITSVHAVVIKRSLELVGGNALHLSWYTNLLSTVVLIPFVIFAGEGPGVVNLLFEGNSNGTSGLKTFVWGSIITGTLGFSMGIASTLSIKVTSPITHMITSAVRGVFATLLGMWLFHDIVTIGRTASIGTILAGSIYYTWLKHLEHSPAPPRTKEGHGYASVDMEAGKAEESRES